MTPKGVPHFIGGSILVFPVGKTVSAGNSKTLDVQEIVDENGSMIYKEETPTNTSDGRTDISANNDTVASDEVSNDIIRPGGGNINRELPGGKTQM